MKIVVPTQSKHKHLLAFDQIPKSPLHPTVSATKIIIVRALDSGAPRARVSNSECALLCVCGGNSCAPPCCHFPTTLKGL